MKHDDEVVETSHGPATVKSVWDDDIPHWKSATAHAQDVVRKLFALIGAPLPAPICPHCNKPI